MNTEEKVTQQRLS